MSRAIDKEFEDADDTGVLDISGRNLRQFPVIPGDLLDYTYVFEADFSNNRFDKVPKEIIGFKALVKLNCHHNSIRWLIEEIYLLTNLKEIDMSRNFLTKLPSEMCGMNLYSINVNNNRLHSLPKEIGNLRNLKYLNFSCNTVSELPESFFSLTSLRHLNLHRNDLRDLPDDICQLTELQYLNVSSNFLSRLPVTLRHMESLQVFNADDNPLEYPPPSVCCRGLVHLCKYLETMEKKGSDHHLFLSGQRDESLRRRKERQHQKKLSSSRPLSESTPVRNGEERGMGLLDEMSNFIPNFKTLTEKDGEKTPTGGVHWSVAQYLSTEKPSNMSTQSKEEYREANYRLYMQQEGHRKAPEPCPSSPAGSSSLNETSTTPTLTGPPKRMSDENVYRSSTGGSPNSDSSQPGNFMGRSLSNEKFPRSGSWNSHKRISSPVLPSKYVAASERQSEEKNLTKPSAGDLSSKSANDLNSADPVPNKTTVTKLVSTPATSGKKPSPSPASAKKSGQKRPPPLDTSKKPQSMSPAHNSPHRLHVNESPSHETSV